ncbi:hypothetical protein N7450_002715 [Penicillium hetheringtonii]|uniref:Uncharacterized protein n=1 Tax=Penicillium hetheringtonii TaxID=911720 RepID=A0AAD6DXV0_9EURO|nr:hypothetical protein N7450_002715 [Penicillium hetheringtonii]
MAVNYNHYAGSLRYRIRSTSWPHPQSAQARQKTCFPRSISQKISHGRESRYFPPTSLGSGAQGIDERTSLLQLPFLPANIHWKESITGGAMCPALVCQYEHRCVWTETGYKKTGDRIVVTGSAGPYLPITLQTLYAARKYAVLGRIRSTWFMPEINAFGVTISLLGPWLSLTSMVDGLKDTTNPDIL